MSTPFPINHAQYELVFTQVFDQKLEEPGPLLNHKDLPITKVHFGSREGITKPFHTFAKLDKECQERVNAFKKEQEEYEKRKSQVYQENLLDIQKALAIQMVALTEIAEIQTA